MFNWLRKDMKRPPIRGRYIEDIARIRGRTEERKSLEIQPGSRYKGVGGQMEGPE